MVRVQYRVTRGHLWTLTAGVSRDDGHNALWNEWRSDERRLREVHVLLLLYHFHSMQWCVAHLSTSPCDMYSLDSIIRTLAGLKLNAEFPSTAIYAVSACCLEPFTSKVDIVVHFGSDEQIRAIEVFSLILMVKLHNDVSFTALAAERAPWGWLFL
jgi:hypothetical protein